MMPKSTNNTGGKAIFFGDAPGQAEVVRIGGVTYRRGECYENVPPEHIRKGGFLIVKDLDVAGMVDRRAVRRGIVLGTAPSMWDDLDAARVILGGLPWDLIAVNGAGWLYAGPVALWCSVHGSKLVRWVERRRELGFDMTFQAYGNFSKSEASGAVIRWNRPNGGGSSGLYATLTALELGYDHLILCGIPIAGDRRHNYEAGDAIIKADCPYESYRSGWTKAEETLKHRVRSMSGWTADLLGRPTVEWLSEPPIDSGTGWDRAGFHTPGEEGSIPSAATTKRQED